MLNYILRRLLLIPVTLFGIMVLNFAIIQFAPGGPVEQIVAQLQGADVSATRVLKVAAVAVAMAGEATISPPPRPIAVHRGLILKSLASLKSSSGSINRPMNASGS